MNKRILLPIFSCLAILVPASAAQASVGSVSTAKANQSLLIKRCSGGLRYAGGQFTVNAWTKGSVSSLRYTSPGLKNVAMTYRGKLRWTLGAAIKSSNKCEKRGSKEWQKINSLLHHSSSSRQTRQFVSHRGGSHRTQKLRINYYTTARLV